MSFPYRAWAGSREESEAAESRGSRVAAQLSAHPSCKSVTMSLEKGWLRIQADVGDQYAVIYSGPFPITKAALIDAFAKLIEDSLKEDT